MNGRVSRARGNLDGGLGVRGQGGERPLVQTSRLRPQPGDPSGAAQPPPFKQGWAGGNARGAPRHRKPYDAEALLDIAVHVFNERGYDGTSMDDIARAAGITKASIYYHVAGKEELLERGVHRALDALFGMLDDPAARVGSAESRLRYVVAQTVAIMSARLPEVALLLRVRGNTPIERWALEQRRAFTHRMAAMVQAAMDEGSLRTDLEAGLVARLLFGTVNSIVEWYRREGRLGADDIASAVEAMVFDGLCLS